MTDQRHDHRSTTPVNPLRGDAERRVEQERRLRAALLRTGGNPLAWTGR